MPLAKHRHSSCVCSHPLLKLQARSEHEDIPAVVPDRHISHKRWQRLKQQLFSKIYWQANSLKSYWSYDLIKHISLHLAFPPVQQGIGDGKGILHSFLQCTPATHISSWLPMVQRRDRKEAGLVERPDTFSGTRQLTSQERKDKLTIPNLFFSHLSHFQKTIEPTGLICRHMLCFGLRLHTVI